MIIKITECHEFFYVQHMIVQVFAGTEIITAPYIADPVFVPVKIAAVIIGKAVERTAFADGQTSGHSFVLRYQRPVKLQEEGLFIFPAVINITGDLAEIYGCIDKRTADITVGITCFKTQARIAARIMQHRERKPLSRTQDIDIGQTEPLPEKGLNRRWKGISKKGSLVTMMISTESPPAEESTRIRLSWIKPMVRK